MKSANHVQTCWSKFSSSRTFVYHQYNCCTLSCKHPRLSPPWLHSMRTRKCNGTKRKNYDEPPTNQLQACSVWKHVCCTSLYHMPHAYYTTTRRRLHLPQACLQ